MLLSLRQKQHIVTRERNSNEFGLATIKLLNTREISESNTSNNLTFPIEFLLENHSGDDDAVADLEIMDFVPDRMHDANYFVAHCQRGSGGETAVEGVEICATDPGGGYADDGVGWLR